MIIAFTNWFFDYKNNIIMKFGEIDDNMVHQKNTLQLCKIHRTATSPGKPIDLASRCECCNRVITKKSIKFKFDEKEIMHLGKAAILAFRFFLFIFLLFFILSIIFAIYPTVRNSNGQFCSSQQNLCSNFFTISFSWINASQQTSYALIITIFTCILFFVLIVTLFVSKKYLLKFKQQKQYYPQQYSILLRFEHAKNYSQQAIKKCLLEWFNVEFDLNESGVKQCKIRIENINENLVEKIYFHFNLHLYESIKKQLNELEVERNSPQQDNKYLNVTYNNSVRKKSQSLLGHSFRDIMHKVERLEQLKMCINDKNLQKTNKCIVVFREKKFVTFIKKYSKSRSCSRTVNRVLLPGDNAVEILDAPFPEEIRYRVQHQHYATKGKIRFFINCSSFLLFIIFSTFIFLIIRSSLNSHFFQNRYFCPTIAITIYLLSYILRSITALLPQFQKQSNQSDQQISKLIKIYLLGVGLQMLPTSLTFLIFAQNIMQESKFIQIYTYIVGLHCVLPHIHKVINFRCVKRWLQQSKLKERIQQQQELESQIELNKIFEKDSQNIEEQYGWVLIVISLTLFIFPLLPIALLLLSFSLFLHYIIFRLCFVYVYREPSPRTTNIFLHAYKILIFSSIWLGFGLFFFFMCDRKYFRNETETWKIVIPISMIIIGALTLLVGGNVQAEQEERVQVYEDAKRHFIHTYDDFNPVYEQNFHYNLSMKKTVRSEAVLAQLNTMSKSLEGTLKDRLFVKTPAVCLQNLGEKQQNNSQIYYQYDIKVTMPQKKQGKKSVPPIFRKSSTDQLLRQNAMKEKKNSQMQLVKFTQLFTAEEQSQQKMKNKIKEVIRGQLKMNKKSLYHHQHTHNLSQL